MLDNRDRLSRNYRDMLKTLIAHHYQGDCRMCVIILESVGNQNTTSTSSEFKVAVYFPILDSMISEMQKCFDIQNIALIKAVHA